MEPQNYCLNFKNRTSTVFTQLGGFQQKDLFVDVTISCEGQNIKAHKVVLAACSPYFRDHFQNNPCQHPIIIIDGLKFNYITAIINFIYKGEVNLTEDEIRPFLYAAETLKMRGLADFFCEEKSTNSISQDIQSEENHPQKTDAPPRKRRNRKRSSRVSNRSDDKQSSRKRRELSSPEVHESSGDESFMDGDNPNGPPFNSVPSVPQNLYSHTHQSSTMSEDKEHDEVEPSKSLEQTLTNPQSFSEENNSPECDSPSVSLGKRERSESHPASRLESHPASRPESHPAPRREYIFIDELGNAESVDEQNVGHRIMMEVKSFIRDYARNALESVRVQVTGPPVPPHGSPQSQGVRIHATGPPVPPHGSPQPQSQSSPSVLSPTRGSLKK